MFIMMLVNPMVLQNRTREVRPVACHKATRGLASWYGARDHGKRMANGKPFNMYAPTAASRVLPLGARIQVTNIRTGQRVAVQVTDHGPYVRGRAIDLSYEAARRIGMIGRGWNG